MAQLQTSSLDLDEFPQSRKKHVSITNPIKRGEGIHAYVSYKVNTLDKDDEFVITQSVARRFR